MPANDAQFSELMRWTISVIIPVLSGLGGVVVGAWLTSKRERAQRRHDFVEKQLRDFYSPLLGLRTEIQMRSELRVKISAAAGSVWHKLCEEAREQGPAHLQKLSEERFPPFERIIEYNNRQLTEELLPAYRRMLSIFRDNMWLAEATTRGHFRELLEFVELWDRWVTETIPAEVVETIGHREESLRPFYRQLEEQHEALRKRLARGEA